MVSGAEFSDHIAVTVSRQRELTLVGSPMSLFYPVSDVSLWNRVTTFKDLPTSFNLI